MLYNKRWEKTIEARPVTLLDRFIDWLGTKNADEVYRWPNRHTCACGQFAKAIGREKWWEPSAPDWLEWKQLNSLALFAAAKPSQLTFGALLAHARRVRDAAKLTDE